MTGSNAPAGDVGSSRPSVVDTPRLGNADTRSDAIQPDVDN